MNVGVLVSIDKPHLEVKLCNGMTWVIYTTSSTFLISVFAICESGAVHSLFSKKMCGGKSEAFCAVAVPGLFPYMDGVSYKFVLLLAVCLEGLDVDDSYVNWIQSKADKDGNINSSQRPKVLNQQSVWIGTASGLVALSSIYEHLSKLLDSSSCWLVWWCTKCPIKLESVVVYSRSTRTTVFAVLPTLMDTSSPE